MIPKLVKKELLDLIEKEMREARARAYKTLFLLLLVPVAISGFFWGVSSIVPLSPLVFLFPALMAGGIIVLILSLVFS